MGISFLSNRLVSFPPVFRRLLLFGIDALLLPSAVWLSFWLRLAHPFHSQFLAAGTWLLLAVLLVGLPLYAFTGQYKASPAMSVVHRFIARRPQRTSSAVAGWFWCDVGCDAPRSSWILVWLLLTGLRANALCPEGYFAELALHTVQAAVACRYLRRRRSRCPVAASLRLAGNHRIVTFLDDNPAYWGRSINGVAISPPQVVMEKEISSTRFSWRFLLFPAVNGVASSTVSRILASPCCRCRRSMISPPGVPGSMP